MQVQFPFGFLSQLFPIASNPHVATVSGLDPGCAPDPDDRSSKATHEYSKLLWYLPVAWRLHRKVELDAQAKEAEAAVEAGHLVGCVREFLHAEEGPVEVEVRLLHKRGNYFMSTRVTPELSKLHVQIRVLLAPF